MALKRCHRLCNVNGAAKLVFLACITLITCGIIVGIILMPLIIMPYLNESKFQDATCTYLSERLIGRVACESKCSKDKSSFPCYSILVNVTDANVTGMLYENYITYSDRHEERQNKCGTAPCLSQAAENVAMTTRFIRTLRRSGSFRCHYRPPAKTTAAAAATVTAVEGGGGGGGSAAVAGIGGIGGVGGLGNWGVGAGKVPTPVLLKRIYSRRQVTHCLVWPAVAVAVGLVLLLGTYYCAGCTVWTQDKTVIA